jgi:integrase/recombinase XerC
MPRGIDAAGAAHLVLAQGVAQLDAPRAMFAGMPSGWGAQQRSRMLNEVTIGGRERLVQRFADFTNEYPWDWRAEDVEGFTTTLRSGGVAHSTIRGYHNILGLFVEFVCDRRYGWVEECEQQFGRAPGVICHEWNTAAHASEYEGRPGRRPLTAEEMQRFFDHADGQVDRVAGSGRKGTLAAFRDAALFKVVYAWGATPSGGGDARCGGSASQRARATVRLLRVVARSVWEGVARERAEAPDGAFGA